MSLAAGGVYALLDAGTVAPDRRPAAAAEALIGGAGMLQYRDKTSAPARHASAELILAVCCRLERPLIINDDVDLAAAIGAQGVHLGQADSSIAAARARLGPRAIIGATCHHSLAGARAAVAAGADYVSFGRFFASRTKPGAPAAKPAVLGAAKREIDVPVVAIGGIDADNGARLLAAGADWLAVGHAIFGAADHRAAARRLARLFE